jgi:hypothetical protein
MVLSVLQDPPAAVDPVVAIVRTASPDRAMADNLPFAKNAINRPSGDQKGLEAPSVPASFSGSEDRNALTQSAV